MKQKVLLEVFLMLIIAAMVYLAIAFIQWDFNPSKWEHNTRIFFVFICLILYLYV
jgi:uncharacterized protein (DUF983 family)